jgi:hypothetical protein
MDPYALPPKLLDATPVSGYRVDLRYADGLAARVDLSYLVGGGPVFEPLRDPEYFARLAIIPGCDTIEWPNEADIAPERLYELAKRSSVAGVPAGS